MLKFQKGYMDLIGQGGVTSMPPVVPFAFTIKMKSRYQDGLAIAIK